jgi:hypothetical protein
MPLIHPSINTYIHTRFILIVILFDEALKDGDGTKCWGYVHKNTKPLPAKFCNMSTLIFRMKTPCGLEGWYQYCGETYGLQLQGRTNQSTVHTSWKTPFTYQNMVTSYCSHRQLVVVFPTPNEWVSKYTGHGVLQLALCYLPLSNSFNVRNLNAKTKSVTSVWTVLNASFTSGNAEI